MGAYDRVQRSALDIKSASAGLDAALVQKPAIQVLAGDRQPLEGKVVQGKALGQGPLGTVLHAQLIKAGYDLTEDGHRYLAGVSVRVYARPRPTPSVIKPQLYPGVAP
jgi:hypothetical protein